MGSLAISLALVGLVTAFSLFYIYEVFESGSLVLEHAPGPVSITREADSQILHIRGDTWQSIAYG